MENSDELYDENSDMTQESTGPTFPGTNHSYDPGDHYLLASLFPAKGATRHVPRTELRFLGNIDPIRWVNTWDCAWLTQTKDDMITLWQHVQSHYKHTTGKGLSTLSVYHSTLSDDRRFSEWLLVSEL